MNMQQLKHIIFQDLLNEPRMIFELKFYSPSNEKEQTQKQNEENKTKQNKCNTIF